MRKRLATLFFVFASFSALASTPTSQWIEIHSPHFTVLTNSSEKDGRHVAAQFERMRSVFQILIPTANDDAGSPIVVLALKDKKSFRTVEPEAYLAKNQLDLAGYFLRAPDKNYVLLRLDSEGEHRFSTVYHEYTHYMMRKADVWMPLWLNEGLAEFYQNATLEDKSVLLGEPSTNDLLYLRQQSLLPLTTLLTVDHNSPYYHDEQKGSVFYSESWALTHYIEINDYKNKTDTLRDYARFLLQHEDPVTAAQHAFGDLKKLEQSLQYYIHQGNFNAFRLNAPVTITEATFEARPISEAEADAVRADVLLDVQRPKDAEALLNTVLQAEPNNALAHETMGALKFRANDIPAARKWYGEAVQLDSQSYLAHYYFAAMTMHDGDRDHDDATEQSLRASIKINPKFAPSYDSLAQFYASRHEKLAEAHQLSINAVQLEPETLAYRVNGAQVLVEDQKFASAIQVLKAARPLAKSIQETDSLERRITDIENYQTSVEQRKKQDTEASSESGSVTTLLTVKHLPSVSADSEPDYPTGAPAGPHHTSSGIIHGVKCSYPTVLTLTLDDPAKPVALYTNNYFKVPFTTANYKPTADIVPCSSIEGMKARIEYGEVTDKRVSGQIISIELSK